MYIRNNVNADVNGDIYIMPHDNENGIIIQDDGEVQLYYNGSEKLNTTNTGVTVTGTLTATTLSGNGSSLTNVDAETLDGINSTSFLRHDANITSNFTLTDNTKIEFGTGADAEAYHTGSHFYIDNDAGNMYIRNNVAGDVGGDIYIMPHDNENGIVIQDDGEVQLYYDNAEKLNTYSAGVTVTGTCNATDFNTTSDRTLKTNVETLEGSLDAVKAMRGVSFDWIDNGQSNIGVIAQEIEEVIPNAVNTNEDGVKSVKYGNLVGVLIEAIKEQQTQIDELKKIIDNK